MQVWKMWRGLVCPRELAFRQADVELGQCYPQWMSTQHPEPKSQQRSTTRPETQVHWALQHQHTTARIQMVASKPETLSHSTPYYPEDTKLLQTNLLLIWRHHSINEERRNKLHAERKTVLTKSLIFKWLTIHSNEHFLNQKEKNQI